ICFFFFFFFSSRRRHTRFDCDWSSDVCSSDLDDADVVALLEFEGGRGRLGGRFRHIGRTADAVEGQREEEGGRRGGETGAGEGRSEERRVGKECRTRWAEDQ